ncbi:hypothetical protein ACVINY_001786 [Sinorhizobium meliloti]
MNRPAPAGKYMHRRRQGEFARHLRLGIVIAANDERPDAGLVEPPKLARQEERRVH